MMPGNTEQPVPLTDAEFSEMMEEFDRAGAWMMHQLQGRKSIMEKHVIGLERQNLAELEVVERLAGSIGIEAFEADVLRLAGLHALNPEATIQAVSVQVHTSIIGMSESVFQVLGRLCDTLVEREPALLTRSSYRCRNALQTALPWELWLALVRHAREAFDPAGLDAEFLAGKLREGCSTQEAFDALISSKRVKVTPGAD